MSESQLVNEIYRYYYNSNVFLWRANCGKFRHGGSWIKPNIDGTPDLIGFMQPGKFVGIECKFGKGEQKDTQIKFQAECVKRDTIYILAYSLQEVIDIIGEPIRETA